jgi:hypothetical protein
VSATQIIEGPVTIRGDLNVTGRLNKGLDTVQANNGKALQVIQGVVQPIATQPNTVPQSGDVRMYGQNATINDNVVPGGTDGYFQIDEYINGSWQHLFEIQPSTTGNANVLDLFISGRVFARDSLLSAPGRFFFKATSTPFGVNAIFAIAYGNGVFVAVTGDGTIARSTDGGVTWGSLIANPFGVSAIYAIAYGNGVFVAATTDDKIARSTDGGVTWGSLIANPFGGSPVVAIAYGNGVFVAETSDSKIARSTDGGVTWGSLIANPFGGSPFVAIAYGNGVFVATTTDGKIARSTDGGVTWGSLIANPFGGSTIYAIAYGNGVFVATTTDGKIARSTDGGVTWGSLIANPFGGSPVIAIAYGNGVFVAGTSDSKIARSLDVGLTWGIKYGDSSIAIVLSTRINCIATDGNGRFVIGGHDSSNIPIAYSDYVEAGAGIVESGSNSNGSYVQFADGTMVCYFDSATGGTLTPNVSEVIAWNLPSSFSSAVYFAAGGSDALNNFGFAGKMYDSFISTASICYFRVNRQTAANVSLIAMGKWK